TMSRRSTWRNCTTRCCRRPPTWSLSVRRSCATGSPSSRANQPPHPRSRSRVGADDKKHEPPKHTGTEKTHTEKRQQPGNGKPIASCDCSPLPGCSLFLSSLCLCVWVVRILFRAQVLELDVPEDHLHPHPSVELPGDDPLVGQVGEVGVHGRLAVQLDRDVLAHALDMVVVEVLGLEHLLHQLGGRGLQHLALTWFAAAEVLAV